MDVWVSIVWDGARAQLAFRGPLTHGRRSARLRACAHDAIERCREVTLDLRAVNLMDAAGLGAIVSVVAHARRLRRRLRLVLPEGRTRSLWRLTRLEELPECDHAGPFWSSTCRTLRASAEMVRGF